MKHDGVPVADCLSHNVQAESALEDETINVTVAAISMFQEGKINPLPFRTCAPNSAPAECPTLPKHATNTI